MSQPKCKHTIFNKKCKSCQDLKKNWYKKLYTEGFHDLEYGQEYPRAIYQPVPVRYGLNVADIDRNLYGLLKQEFYDLVWQVYYQWVEQGRSSRDLLVCELFAAQKEGFSTSRDISSTLRRKRLRPRSRLYVLKTLKEIHSEVLKLVHSHQENRDVLPMDSNPERKKHG